MKRLLLATTLFVSTAFAFPVVAADLGQRPSANPSQFVPITNWGGWYLGGNVGYGFGNGEFSTSFLPSEALFGARNSITHDHPQGVTGGAQIGYNWEVSSMVFGVEADFQGSDVQGSSQQSVVRLSGALQPNSSIHSDQKLPWFGTLRGRLGVTLGQTLLLYGTGGFAYGEVNASAVIPDAGKQAFPASVGGLKTGWVAGGGLEWLFRREWSAKVEYLHTDLGAVSAVGPNNIGGLATAAARYDWKLNSDAVSIGVNYHFN